MRTTLLPLAVLFLSAHVHAQLTAGEVPNGMSALDLNIDIALTTSFTTDSASLELDCDDFFDAWAWLHRGAPQIDAPNYAMLHFVDTDMEVCADLAPTFQQRPKYYAFGEPLDCAGGFEWQSIPQLVLGDLGTFTAIGPAVIDSMYIAYRRGATMGWIELSIDINDDAQINLQVHRVLSLCPGAQSIPLNEGPAPVALFPNPNAGEQVRVESRDAWQWIELMDMSGRSIARYQGHVRTIAAPEVAGTYLVRIVHADGRSSMVPLVRY